MNHPGLDPELSCRIRILRIDPSALDSKTNSSMLAAKKKKKMTVHLRVLVLPDRRSRKTVELKQLTITITDFPSFTEFRIIHIAVEITS